MVTDFNAERVDAAAIAKEEGIAELTPAHWKVIEFMQKDFKRRRYQVYAMPKLALRRPGTFFFLL